jgi:hypothetical protein
LFPKVSKSIEKLIAEGKLKKKEVMNHCKEKAVPTSCKECHQK